MRNFYHLSKDEIFKLNLIIDSHATEHIITLSTGSVLSRFKINGSEE